jgi:pimeloyl-ACP methyl ester carboxylesterase
VKNQGLNGVVALASRPDREPIASLLVRPDWAWALGQRPGLARLELSCATLRVRSAGSVGPPIVFLIDPPDMVEHYDVLIQILAQQARVVCVELPGSGFSTPGPAFDFGIQAYTLTIEESAEEQASCWTAWISQGPDGPVEDEGEPELP